MKKINQEVGKCMDKTVKGKLQSLVAWRGVAWRGVAWR